jgi:hypothetical protein
MSLYDLSDPLSHRLKFVQYARCDDPGGTMGLANLLRSYWRVLVAVSVIAAAAICLIFVSGPILSCFCGFVIAVAFFWMRETHQKFYGASEVAVGLLLLYANYPLGRGGFSSDFSDDFQHFHASIVLISTVGAVYIMVRGLDNFWNPRLK